MKRIMMALAFGLALVPFAYAEMIQGMITRVDSANNQISVWQSDAARNAPQQLDVKVSDDTETKNVGSIDDLQVGQEVKIDASGDKTEGIVEARSIEVSVQETVPGVIDEMAPESSRLPSSLGTSSSAPSASRTTPSDS